jgi:hypothetical protein
MRITPVLSIDEVARRGRGPPRRRARIDDHHPRDALAAEPRDRPRGRGRGARRGRRPRHHRGDRRPAPHRARPPPRSNAGAAPRGRGQAFPRRPRRLPGRGRDRRHDRRRHHDRRASGRHRGLRHRRHRRGAPRLRGRAFDISADLHELARTPVTVVAAGAKAILDLPKTLEVLETLGVPVIAFGQDALPAFWSRDSGLRAPLRMDAPAEVARAHADARGAGACGRAARRQPDPARGTRSPAPTSPR